MVWKTQLDESGQPANFHAKLDQELSEAVTAGAEALTAVVKAAGESGILHNPNAAAKHSLEVTELMRSRRAERDSEERKRLSKLIWRSLRKERQEKQQARLDEAASKGAGLAKMRRILHKGPGRLAGTKDEQVVLKTTLADISEVFDTFYEKLYEALRGQEATAFEAEHAGRTKEISADEVVKSLVHMKNDKAAADDGLVAEMLKAGNEKLIKAIASIFRAAPPNAWKTSRLSVILKTGDCYMPKNYRPISIHGQTI